jgi:diguanylate cyclase (GGDEF)-like protein/PAS domain S-box-containing protein
MTLVAPSQAYDHDPVAFARPAARLDESSLMRELDVLVAHDQARFAFLLEVSLDGLWMWDLETPDRGWMSPRFWERLGYDPHDHAQRAADWGRLMHPDASRAAVARFEAFCAQPDHMYDEVLRYRHRDGSSVWLRCRGMAVRNAGGRAIRLLGAHNDITALKHTEAELLQGRAELIQLLDQSSAANAWLELAEQIGRIGHWRHSLADEALIWSSEMYRIHGVDPATFTPNPQSAAAFAHPDDRARIHAIVGAAIRDGMPFEFAARLVRQDGPVRHVQCRGEARRDAQGAVGMIVGVMVDISEQKNLEHALREANARLEELANVDSLTGLANRRRFDETLVQEWRRAVREGDTLSLVMVDIDRFKGFNDRYGHIAGDECLRRVASVVADHGRRPCDIAARYGGEEMVLLLPGTSLAGAEKVARACRSAIAALGIWHEGNTSCGGVVTASFGVATALPAEEPDMADWSDLLNEADRLLYEAKRTGRNKVVVQECLFPAGPPAMAPDEEARLATLAQYQESGAAQRSAARRWMASPAWPLP